MSWRFRLLDPFLLVALLLAGLVVAGHASVEADLLETDLWTHSWYIAFLVAVLVSLAVNVRSTREPERPFWLALLVSYSSWLLLSIVFLVGPEDWSYNLTAQTAQDVGFLLFYLGLVLAGEVRPETFLMDPGGRREKRLEIAGLLLFSLALLGIFVLIPNLSGSAHQSVSGRTLESYLLYIVLDVYLVSRFAYLGTVAGNGVWSRVYSLFAVASALHVVTDVLELLLYLPSWTLEISPRTYCLWYFPLVVAIAASRSRTWLSADAEQPDLEARPPMGSPRRAVLYILILFVLFVGLAIFGIDESLARPRGILIVLAAVSLGVLSQRQQRLLDRKARRYFEEKEEALSSVRELAAHLEERVRERTAEIRETRTIALVTLARLTESRDTDTGAHIERISEFSRVLALELRRRGNGGLGESFLEELYRSSALHDIGKVGIPDAILLKPGPLTDEEMEIMKTHTTIGGDTLRSVVSSHGGEAFLRMAMDIAYSHHERWDGGGYPCGLRGEDIPLAARIVALVDAYDAITSERPYKAAMTHEEAVRRIGIDRGGHFDPQLVEAFFSCAPRFAELRDQMS